MVDVGVCTKTADPIRVEYAHAKHEVAGYLRRPNEKPNGNGVARVKHELGLSISGEKFDARELEFA